MAPEVQRGEAASIKSDIYSFGVCCLMVFVPSVKPEQDPSSGVVLVPPQVCPDS